MSLVSELRRRNVLRMAVLYAVAAWLIMQVAEVVVTLAALPDWSGQVVLALLVIGFPIALIFSWFYELTPEGISLEKDVDIAESMTHVTGRRMDFIVISLLCAGLILFAYDKWWMPGPPDQSIAVLPFENMSADPDQEYFSDGISEELLNLLAQFPGLRVAARTSSFQFKGQHEDIAKIADALNVSHILAGSVRKSGNKLRITAQLIKADDGFNLWSNSYDRELDDIFVVQDEIAGAISEALRAKLLSASVEAVPRAVATKNTEAYEAYLRGRYLMVQRTTAGIEGAVREFEKAVELETDYALAHAELAIAIAFGRFYRGLTVTETIARATPHAERAMAIDPALAEAHAAVGVLSWGQGNLEEALAHFRQAIRINPNYAVVHNWMGSIFANLGRYEEEFAARATELQLDPLSSVSRSNYVGMLIVRKQLDEAARELEKLASISPALYAARNGLLRSVDGKWTNAVLGFLDALLIDPESVVTKRLLAPYFAAIGLETEALVISERPLPFVLTILGKPGDAVVTAKARVAEDPDALAARRDLGLTLAGAGDYAQARPILEEIWQWSGGRVTCCRLLYSFGFDSAAALIAIHRDAGEETEVNELLAALRGNVRRYREAGIKRADLYVGVDFEEGLAAYLAGERERGLALIASGAEDGFFIPQNEAYLQTLYDDPGFAPIRASQEARQARERERFLAIVCTDNPYEAVWQPAKNTCKHLAKASDKLSL